MWPTTDLSPFFTNLAPGLAAAIAFFPARSAIPDSEKLRQPWPDVGGMLIVATLLTVTYLYLAEVSHSPLPFAEYGTQDLARNLLFYTCVGLVPGVLDRWHLSPVVIAAATVVNVGVYGITRTTSMVAPFGGPANQSQVTSVALTCVALSIAVVVRASFFSTSNESGLGAM